MFFFSGRSLRGYRIYKTRKQRNKNFTKQIIVFIPIGRNKIVHQDNIKILYEILVLLIYCVVILFPEQLRKKKKKNPKRKMDGKKNI